jgi:hypothetical protein
LLQILTKEPAPPSEAGKGQKYPVPPTLDRVMTHAFKKTAAHRIASVGALADAVGAAYGLTGTHLEWAKTTEAELTTRVNAAMPGLLATVTAPRGANVADSFFGESDSLDGMGDPFAGAPPAPPIPAPGAPAPAYAAANQSLPPQSIAGVPKSSNTLLFLAVGGGALFVGIALVVVFVLLR